jgi:hypothetical protein
LTGKVLNAESSTATYLIQAESDRLGDPYSITFTVEPQSSSYNYDYHFTRTYKDYKARNITDINSVHYKMSSSMAQECVISVGGDKTAHVTFTAGVKDDRLGGSFNGAFYDVPIIITGGIEHLTGSPSTWVAASTTSDPQAEKSIQDTQTDFDITTSANEPASTARESSTPNPTVSVVESEPTSGALPSPRNVLRSMALAAVTILAVWL